MATQKHLEGALAALKKADEAYTNCVCLACVCGEREHECARLIKWEKMRARVESIRSRM